MADYIDLYVQYSSTCQCISLLEEYIIVFESLEYTFIVTLWKSLNAK